MKCPRCNQEVKSKVLETRTCSDAKMRVRRCLACGHVYKTTETIDAEIYCIPACSETMLSKQT